MTRLYAYSLLPVLSVALLLFFTSVFRGRRGGFGLASFCLSVAVWSATLLLTYYPSTMLLGNRLAAIGSFVTAGYLHAAYDFTGQRRYGLVGLAYVAAAGITIVGALWPGMLYSPVTLSAGPMFWPGMALASAAALLPLWHLAAAWQKTPAGRRGRLLALFTSGVLAYFGAWLNATLLSRGQVLPYGMLLILAALLTLGHVVRGAEAPRQRRLLERSLLYSALAAFLSAGFLFGVMTLTNATAEPLLGDYRVGAFVLLALAALAFEPLRQQLQQWLGAALLGDRPTATNLADALAMQEQRAGQAERLAELGAFASAVAHEVRNPLGVLSAHVRVLERAGASADSVVAMQDQIDRASRFVDDLLRYGRPRPLEVRDVELPATVELAYGTACSGRGERSSDVAWELRVADGPRVIEADQAQLGQVLVVLFDNALLSLEDRDGPQIRASLSVENESARIVIEDNGPGIPEALRDRLFEPFVTGRQTEGTRPGTGLGLAIARGIVERHGGTIEAGRSGLGGARFDVVLPAAPPPQATAPGREGTGT